MVCVVLVLFWYFSGKEFVCQCRGCGLGSIPRLGRSPEEGNGNPLSILVWEMLWTEEPGGPQSLRSQRVRHDLATGQQWHKLDILHGAVNSS